METLIIVKRLDSIKVSEFDARRISFAIAKSFNDVRQIVWPSPIAYHSYYQHYTTIDRLLPKILKQEWWLSRSDNVRLNDLQEAKKFGDMRRLKRTYQASFVKGTSESAAMWGLYTNDNPLAVRILIPGNKVKHWMTQVELCGEDKCGGVRVESAGFRDILYAAVPFIGQEVDSLDKTRGMSVSWEGMTCNFDHNEGEKKSLLSALRDEDLTGWLKDYEWHHERESRLCVLIDKVSSRKAMPIKVPLEVISSMSFTLSPWLNSDLEAEVKSIIKTALEKISDSEEFRSKGLKLNSKPFRRSVLNGALNIRK